MAIVYQLTYEHDATEQHIELRTNDLKTKYMFPDKSVNRKPGSVAGAGTVFDPNKTYRIFSGSAVLSAVLFKEMDTQIRPAAAPDYTGIYPRLTVVKLGAGEEWTDVEVVCMGWEGTMTGDGKHRVSFVFEEKSS